MSENLTTLNRNIFESCSSLTDVVIPDNITFIGRYAFLGCALTDIKIPKNVKDIDFGAFFNTRFDSVVIPKNVKTIGEQSFGFRRGKKIPGFTIYGYAGSAAEKYANDNGFIFIAIEDPPCAHENTEIRNEVKATCISDGYTGDVYCLDCGEEISKGSVIPALGHSDSDNDGKCDSCGENIVKDYLFYCSMCPTYEKMKNVPVVGIICSVVHFFVHLAQMIGRIS